MYFVYFHTKYAVVLLFVVVPKIGGGPQDRSVEIGGAAG